MAIEVRCGCGQVVYAEFRYAGQHVQCPHCRGAVAVPVATASSTPPAPPAPPTGEPRRPSFWATQTGQMLLWILVVFVVFPVVGVFVRGCQEREDAKRPTLREILDKADSKRR